MPVKDITDDQNISQLREGSLAFNLGIPSILKAGFRGFSFGFESFDELIFCFAAVNGVTCDDLNSTILGKMSSEWNPHDSDDEDIVDDTIYENQKDAILFMVGCNDLMVKERDSNTNDAPGKSIAHIALECAYQLLCQKIISNPRDMFGIILYNTEKTQVEGNYRNLYYLLPLEQPDASRIRELKDFLEDTEVSKNILKPYDGSDFSMANAFFFVNQTFNSAATNYNSKRLFIITDDPAPGTKDTLKQALTRVGDLEDLGISIEPFFIKHDDAEFDTSIFWDDVVFREDDDGTDINTIAAGDAETRLKALSALVNSKRTPKRSLFQVNIELGPEVLISVNGYLPAKYQSLARTSYVYSKGEKPQLVTSESATVDTSTSMSLQKEEVKRSYRMGGENIPIAKPDFEKIRRFGNPVIRMLGFKDRSQLRIWENMRPAYFLYPSEQPFVGSTRTYTALLRKLQKSNKFGMAWAITRRNSAPSFQAIVPSNVESETQGLYMIQLPFADDIRTIPEILTVENCEELTKIMREILRVFKRASKYSPDAYNNPSKSGNVVANAPGLNWQYKMIQVQALDEEVPSQSTIKDTTLPKYGAIHSRNKKTGLAEEWLTLLGDIAPDHEDPGTKRTYDATQTEQNPTKNVKIPDDEQVRKHYEARALKKFKVDELRAYLLSKGTSSDGKLKGELIEMVERSFTQ